MKVKIEFNVDTDAFIESDFDEIRRILMSSVTTEEIKNTCLDIRVCKNSYRVSNVRHPVIDINGHVVGFWKVVLG